MNRVASTAALALLSASVAAGHSGGLDKHGCHRDHKRGGYHCHGGGSARGSGGGGSSGGSTYKPPEPLTPAQSAANAASLADAEQIAAQHALRFEPMRAWHRSAYLPGVERFGKAMAALGKALEARSAIGPELQGTCGTVEREAAAAAKKIPTAPDPVVDEALRATLKSYVTYGQACGRGELSRGPQLLEAGSKAYERFAATLRPYGLKP